MIEHRHRLGIPEENSLNLLKSQEINRQSQRAMLYWYSEVNPAGKVIRRYLLEDARSVYPPFERTIVFKEMKKEPI